MANDFSIGLRRQEEWSWLVAIDLFFGGLGGGLFLFSGFLNLPIFMGFLSLGLVILGGLVLLVELGHPLRAWRAICSLSTSWISRGVLFVALFIVFGFLYLAPSLGVFSWLPWGAGTVVGRVFWVVASLSAFMVTLYPGFVLSSALSIPFWHSPLLPVLFFSHSVMGAGGIVLLFSGEAGAVQGVGSLVALTIAANFVMVSIYVLTMKGSTVASREAVRRLSEGALGWAFGVGVVLVGMVIPFLVVVWVPSAAFLAGLFILAGSLLFRYCVLKAGVYVPFALT
jgi:formate-dependent nitrite reductase membrane component NrfD